MSIASRIRNERLPDQSIILTINAGSSSLKTALFRPGEMPVRLASGRVECIGRPGTRLMVSTPDEDEERIPLASPEPARVIEALLDWLEREVGFRKLAVVGHRVVHGGGRYHRPEPVTDELIETLRELEPFDPDHLPWEIQIIEAIRARDPNLPQVSCFDTTFHHDIPRLAQIVPIPRRYEAHGVRRYGFHGLSFQYLMGALHREGRPGEADGRVILAHLGSGASMAAILGGRCIDTTMGFTPASGLVMATRTGDVDPGLARYLLKVEGLDVQKYDDLVNHESGLLGVSETSSDVRDLLEKSSSDNRAAEAIGLFCYRARGWIGSLAAALGGIDSLVFSGGIGENSAEVRRLICEGLGFLGIELDPPRNSASAPLISADGAAVAVRVIHTDEEVVIAEASGRFMGSRVD